MRLYHTIHIVSRGPCWNSVVTGALLAWQAPHQSGEFWCMYGHCCRGAQKPVSVIAPNVSALLQCLPHISDEVDVVVPACVTWHMLQRSRLKGQPVGPPQKSDAACCLEQHWSAALAGSIEMAAKQLGILAAKNALGGNCKGYCRSYKTFWLKSVLMPVCVCERENVLKVSVCMPVVEERKMCKVFFLIF